MKFDLTIIGGGLAGSEAAWQAAKRGLRVGLYEMRPDTETGAHQTGYLAELVCSNSLGSDMVDRASGLLKTELRKMGSLLIQLAEENAVPAGSALAVDRDEFSAAVTKMIGNHPKIEIIREEVTQLPPGLTVIASGPLTSSAMSDEITALTGQQHLFFYDAISPIVNYDSINMEVAFRASRYNRGDDQEGDYLNCPLTEDEYMVFLEALQGAERIKLHGFEKDLETTGVKTGPHQFFEGCLPVEIIAQRGKDSLAFGPLRPVGLVDPRTGRRPYAIVQLRQDNLAGSMYNMVGFQTNLKFPEQRSVFRLIPGLENAEFLRYGQMHRNTFIFSPDLLEPTMQFKQRNNLLFAGQITGIEGYAGNIASGLLAGVNASRLHQSKSPIAPPQDTMLGALCHYITHADAKDFQPMKANFGIVPPLTDGKRRGKRERASGYAERALVSLEDWLDETGF